MHRKQAGYSVVEVFILLIVVGLLGLAGWMVINRKDESSSSSIAENKNELTTTKQSNNEENSSEVVARNIALQYTIPDQWNEITYQSPEYPKIDLRSPDYKEGDPAQFNLISGAVISISLIDWVDITGSTTIEEAFSIVKNNDGSSLGYFDGNSAELKTVGTKQIITFNSGHTTDGVTVLYKTKDATWYSIAFTTSTNDTAEYDAQLNTHYPTFELWLEEVLSKNP